MHVKGIAPFTGLVRTCREILNDGGLRGFYQGCGVNLLRTVPAAALTFTSFELVSRGMRKFLSKKANAKNCIPHKTTFQV